MLGTRGVPASYSGFETCVEEVGARLARRGHAVTVYCRRHHITYPNATYRGMRLVKLPTVQNKYLDTIVHTLISSAHALGQAFDVAMYFIVGNSPLTALPRLAGVPTAINVDGLDWRREKWPAPAKAYIRWAEWAATRVPHEVVTDSREVERYYRERYGCRTTYIAYGSDLTPVPAGRTLARWGLAPRRYVLFVGRLVPENRVHHLVEAFRGLPTDMRCVIVGDAPYAERYIAQLRATDDPRVVFTGYCFGEGYRELLSHAYAFVETSGVGGTHPAVTEAMSLGNCVIVNGTPENLETIGDAGLAYDGRTGGAALRSVLARALDSPETARDLGARSARRAQEHYSWDRVTDGYEELFRRLVARQRRHGARAHRAPTHRAPTHRAPTRA